MQLGGEGLEEFTSDQVAVTTESLVAEGSVTLGKHHSCIGNKDR